MSVVTETSRKSWKVAKLKYEALVNGDRGGSEHNAGDESGIEVERLIIMYSF